MQRILVRIEKENKVIDIYTIEATIKRYSKLVNLYGLEKELCKGIHTGGYSFIKIFTEEEREKAWEDLLEGIEI